MHVVKFESLFHNTKRQYRQMKEHLFPHFYLYGLVFCGGMFCFRFFFQSLLASIFYEHKTPNTNVLRRKYDAIQSENLL